MPKHGDILEIRIVWQWRYTKIQFAINVSAKDETVLFYTGG